MKLQYLGWKLWCCCFLDKNLYSHCSGLPREAIALTYGCGPGGTSGTHTITLGIVLALPQINLPALALRRWQLETLLLFVCVCLRVATSRGVYYVVAVTSVVVFGCVS